jgi:hypothetical protein
MGLRGPQPKSAEQRILEGERAHRPLPAPRAASAVGLPERPKRMTASARRVWDLYVEQMAQLGTLRPVDGFALQRLCEDVALLEELQLGTRKLAAQLKRDDAERAREIERQLAGTAGTNQDVGALIAERVEIRLRRVSGILALAKTHEGRRITTTINAVAARIQRQELQFGLTPVSASRVEGNVVLPPGALNGADSSIEASLC